METLPEPPKAARVARFPPPYLAGVLGATACGADGSVLCLAALRTDEGPLRRDSHWDPLDDPGRVSYKAQAGNARLGGLTRLAG